MNIGAFSGHCFDHAIDAVFYNSKNPVDSKWIGTPMTGIKPDIEVSGQVTAGATQTQFSITLANMAKGIFLLSMSDWCKVTVGYIDEVNKALDVVSPINTYSNKLLWYKRSYVFQILTSMQVREVPNRAIEFRGLCSGATSLANSAQVVPMLGSPVGKCTLGVCLNQIRLAYNDGVELEVAHLNIPPLLTKDLIALSLDVDPVLLLKRVDIYEQNVTLAVALRLLSRVWRGPNGRSGLAFSFTGDALHCHEYTDLADLPENAADALASIPSGFYTPPCIYGVTREANQMTVTMPYDPYVEPGMILAIAQKFIMSSAVGTLVNFGPPIPSLMLMSVITVSFQFGTTKTNNMTVVGILTGSFGGVKDTVK